MRLIIAALASAASVGLPTGSMAEPDPAGSAVERVREVLAGTFKDPTSAEILITKGPWEDTATINYRFHAGELVCVRVNAKNSYGGYVGFRPYLVVLAPDGRSTAWPVDDRSPGTDRRTREACAPTPPSAGASPEPSPGVTFR